MFVLSAAGDLKLPLDPRVMSAHTRLGVFIGEDECVAFGYRIPDWWMRSVVMIRIVYCGS
jgi:hypothetical protein